ncbi:MAG: Maf family protein [candidate division FCPU426 bacterium]
MSKKNTAPLVLASASPRRRQLLRQAGLRFRVVPSRWEEGRPQGDPGRFAEAAARHKARDVAARLSRPAWVLAADTVVIAGREAFGKPVDRAQARRMLRRLAGRRHRVVTGVALLHSATGRGYSWREVTRVWMRPISRSEEARYLQAGEWRDKAGAYGIQGRAGAFIHRIEGCAANVVGLPLAAVCAALARLGVRA